MRGGNECTERKAGVFLGLDDDAGIDYGVNVDYYRARGGTVATEACLELFQRCVECSGGEGGSPENKAVEIVGAGSRDVGVVEIGSDAINGHAVTQRMRRSVKVGPTVARVTSQHYYDAVAPVFSHDRSDCGIPFIVSDIRLRRLSTSMTFTLTC